VQLYHDFSSLLPMQHEAQITSASRFKAQTAVIDADGRLSRRCSTGRLQRTRAPELTGLDHDGTSCYAVLTTGKDRNRGPIMTFTGTCWCSTAAYPNDWWLSLTRSR